MERRDKQTGHEAGENAPDFGRGYLRVPFYVWEALYCQTPLTRRQLQILSVVLRESWGWRDKKDGVRLWTRPLSPRRFAQATGLSTDRMRRELGEMVARGLFLERDGRYRLNLDRRRWVTRKDRLPKPLVPPPL